MVNICVIALVGLPASGKTTFCQHFLNSSINLNCIHICYDELFSYSPSCSELSYKKERTQVLEKLKHTIGRIKSNESAFLSKSNDIVIVCDDNNYYAGMRYEFYKICKEYHLAFGQIYFPIDLDVALVRNRNRATCCLPAGVIETMHCRLEKPSQKNHWETYTLTVHDSFDAKGLQSFLKICLDNPVKRVIVNKAIIEQNPSVIHEMDLLLRKRIKQALKGKDGDLSEKARFLNEKRRAILFELKTNGNGKDLNVNKVLEQFAFG